MAEAATGITLMIEPGEYACPLRILALGASTRELAAESSWRVATSRPEQSVSVMSWRLRTAPSPSAALQPTLFDAEGCATSRGYGSSTFQYDMVPRAGELLRARHPSRVSSTRHR